MASPIDITPVRPNVWVVLSEDDPEGGTIIRRFERFTCTCGQEDGACRHIAAARTLIAKSTSVDTDEHDVGSKQMLQEPNQQTRKTKRPPEPDSYEVADEDGIVFEVAPSVRKARPITVSDRTALRVAGKAVAA